MKEKIVSQLNPEGYFIGQTVADESPLEPDVYLLPAYAIDADPPHVPEGKRAKWDGIGFVLEDILQPEQPQPQPPTQEQIKAALSSAVQDHMDAAARAAGYDDIKSAVTYAEEPVVPKFQQEGQTFRAWRSLCWAACYEVMAQVEAGERDVPTADELIAELPALEIPA